MAAQAPAAPVHPQRSNAYILGRGMGAGALSGGIAAALFTSASPVAGIIAGGTLLPVVVLVLRSLNTCLPGREYIVFKAALGLLAAAGTGFLLPTLLGYSITWGAVAAIDFCAAIVVTVTLKNLR